MEQIRALRPPADQPILGLLQTNAHGDRVNLFSGLLSPAGNEPLILLAIHQGLVHPCFSEDILEEYATVLARLVFAFPSDGHASQSPTVGSA